MNSIGEEDKERIRQSDEYKKTKAILDFHFTQVTKASSKVGPVLPPEYVFGTRYEMLKKNCGDFVERWEEAKRISEILRDMKNLDASATILPKFRAMNKMLVYLGLVESLGVSLADIVLVLLIANEKEVHTESRSSRHVARIKELEDIELGYKMAFLKEEGIEIFSRFINKTTRNKIAHLDFTIDDKGIITSGENYEPIKIDECIDDFWKGVRTLELVFEDIGFAEWFERRNRP